MRKRRLPILLVDGSSIEQKLNLMLINHLLATLSTKLISRNKACFHFSLFISYFINSNIRLRFLRFQTNEIPPSEGDETVSSQIHFLWIKKMPFIAFPYHFLSLCLQMEKAGQLFAQRRAINILFSFVTLMHERDTRK